METINKIEKEHIPMLSFGNEEVLSDPQLLQMRKFNLNRAMTLGNTQKNKVRIHFIPDDGKVHMVETTIWAVGKDYITLKAGTIIPIKSILRIEF